MDRALVRDDSKKKQTNKQTKKPFLASEWALWCNDFMIIKPFVGLQHDQINTFVWYKSRQFFFMYLSTC